MHWRVSFAYGGPGGAPTLDRAGPGRAGAWWPARRLTSRRVAPSASAAWQLNLPREGRDAPEGSRGLLHLGQASTRRAVRYSMRIVCKLIPIINSAAGVMMRGGGGVR